MRIRTDQQDIRTKKSCRTKTGPLSVPSATKSSKRWKKPATPSSSARALKLRSISRLPIRVYGLLKRFEAQLRYLFIVSAVTLTQGSGNGTGGIKVEVKKADGQKCERCWNYSTRVGEDPTYPTVCERCSAVLKEL